jgi:hypothetical protein
LVPYCGVHGRSHPGRHHRVFQEATRERYVNKRIAHIDCNGTPTVPTAPEIDAAVELIGELPQKYTLLLTGADLRLGILVTFDWTSVFTVPWIDPAARWPPPRGAGWTSQSECPVRHVESRTSADYRSRRRPGRPPLAVDGSIPKEFSAWRHADAYLFQLAVGVVLVRSA